jgi:glycosyltransferase involved in cell wall biosynthesis
MNPHVGFVMEQALGHVAYTAALRTALRSRTDAECEWLDVTFEETRASRVPVVGKSWVLRGNYRCRRAIARAHRRRRLDAMFVHTSMISILSGDYVARIPTMLSLDATPLNFDELAQWYAHPVGSWPVERAKLAVHRTLLGQARLVTAWSEWTRRSLVNDYGVDPGKIVVLHPGTTLSNFPDPGSRGPRRPGPVRLLFVGGDFVRKGGDLLLDVFRNHLKGACELHLVTGADVPAGDGVFVYKGVKPHSEQLLRLYADADVFVLPTRGDCLAVVLGEAMASSLPIVTTRVGAHAEAVDDGKSGFVIDAGDGPALRDRLERLARSPELCARMGRESRRVGEERFDMSKNANRILDLLVDIGRPHGRA